MKKGISVLVFLFFCAVSFANDSISAVQVKSVVPKMKKGGKTVRYDTIFGTIFYLRDMVVYQTQYDLAKRGGPGEVITEPRPNYIILKEGSKLAYNYFPDLPSITKWGNADSLLNALWFYNPKMDDLFNDYRTALLSVKQLNVTDFAETYSSGEKQERENVGVSTFYFSKRKFNTPYSLSDSLDKAKNAKLVKVVIKNKAHYYEKMKTLIPEFNHSIEFKSFNVPANAKERGLFSLINSR